MVSFLCLGSGSSGNCYCLWTEHTGIIIDVGIGYRMLRRYFQTYHLDPNLFKAVFVTHDHADHIKAVGKVASELGLPVYTTLGVHEGIARNYCVSPKIHTERKCIIEKGVTTDIGEFHVTPFPVPHDSNDCVGYAIDVEGVRFCLITDVGHVTDTIKTEVSMANYLVLESNHDHEMLMAGPYPAYLKGRISGEYGHLSNREAAELLANSAGPELKHVWLCHLSEENNHPVLAIKTVDTVLRSYGIIPNVDFKVDVLKRKVPSEVYELS